MRNLGRPALLSGGTVGCCYSSSEIVIPARARPDLAVGAQQGPVGLDQGCVEPVPCPHAGTMGAAAVGRIVR